MRAYIVTRPGCLGCEEAALRLGATGYELVVVDHEDDRATLLKAGLMAIKADEDKDTDIVYPLIFIEGGLAVDKL